MSEGNLPVAAVRHVDLDPDSLWFLEGKLAPPVGQRHFAASVVTVDMEQHPGRCADALVLGIRGQAAALHLVGGDVCRREAARI